jgi:hypothetical protein
MRNRPGKYRAIGPFKGVSQPKHDPWLLFGRIVYRGNFP